MAYLDQGIGEAYVSPQIEATLGFSQKEWLEDPVRWYHQIHPDDKRSLEHRSRGDVSFGQAAAIGVSGDGSRRPRGLVSLRSPAGAARRRRALVHSRRRIRHHRAQTGAGGAAGRAQRRLGDFRYRGRADRRAGSGRTDRALQSGLRADDRLFDRGIQGQVRMGSVRRPGGSRAIQESVSADSRQARRAPNTKAVGSRATASARIIAWSAAVLPGTKQTPTLHHCFGNRCYRAEAGADAKFRACWKRRRMPSWWSTRAGRLFW